MAKSQKDNVAETPVEAQSVPGDMPGTASNEGETVADKGTEATEACAQKTKKGCKSDEKADAKCGAKAGAKADAKSEEDAIAAEVDEALAGVDGEIDTEAVAQAALEAIHNAQAEAKDWQDKYLRLHAEWDTYRRRTNEQREEERKRATEKLMENLIPIIDDFERTIDYAEKNGETGLLDGVVAVKNKFCNTLQNNGLVVIDPKGEAYNALEAQAVAMVDDASVPDETVAEVYQKGYKMGAKVLRSAMVTVATGGPKREVEDKDADE